MTERFSFDREMLRATVKKSWTSFSASISEKNAQTKNVFEPVFSSFELDCCLEILKSFFFWGFALDRLFIFLRNFLLGKLLARNYRRRGSKT